jgi:hypothetical protein
MTPFGLIIRLLLLWLIVSSCTGCATTPEFIDECKYLFAGEEIAKCEDRVMREERTEFMRLERERERLACVPPRQWRSYGMGSHGRCEEVW